MPSGGRLPTFLVASLVGVLNPKTILFFVAILPQFLDAGAGSPTPRMPVPGGSFAALAVARDSVWALAAASQRT
jgi:threonine/homoserine/homoserine lactone efflux protein